MIRRRSAGSPLQTRTAHFQFRCMNRHTVRCVSHVENLQRAAHGQRGPAARPESRSTPGESRHLTGVSEGDMIRAPGPSRASLRIGGRTMRFSPLVAVTLLIWLSAAASAQEEWIEFVSKEDRFTSNFPGQPKVTQTTYMSQYGAELPARVYSAEQGKSRYSMTVVDYSQIEKILTAKAQK